MKNKKITWVFVAKLVLEEIGIINYNLYIKCYVLLFNNTYERNNSICIFINDYNEYLGKIYHWILEINWN